MADFGELCPLFNTGVYKEVTFPCIAGISTASAAQNLLETRLEAAGSGKNTFNFGRTVVVTDAFIRRYLTNLEAENLYLGSRLSAAAAAQTTFGTATVTTTLSIYTIHNWWHMTCVSKTITSAEVLSLGVGTLTAVTQGSYHLIVRYREK